jgi:hypothetical protein
MKKDVFSEMMNDLLKDLTQPAEKEETYDVEIEMDGVIVRMDYDKFIDFVKFMHGMDK